MMILEASVFPLPDSPEMTMQESLRFLFMVLYAASAMAKICGGRSYISRPLYYKRVSKFRVPKS